MHDYLVETRYFVEQFVVDFMRDPVRFSHRKLRINGDFDFGV